MGQLIRLCQRGKRQNVVAEIFAVALGLSAHGNRCRAWPGPRGMTFDYWQGNLRRLYTIYTLYIMACTCVLLGPDFITSL